MLGHHMAVKIINIPMGTWKHLNFQNGYSSLMANHQHIQTRILPVQKSWLDKACLCGLGDSENLDHKHIGIREFMYYVCIYTHSQMYSCEYTSLQKQTRRKHPLTGGSEWRGETLKGTKWAVYRCGKMILSSASATHSLFVLLSGELMSLHLCFLHLPSQSLSRDW